MDRRRKATQWMPEAAAALAATATEIAETPGRGARLPPPGEPLSAGSAADLMLPSLAELLLAELLLAELLLAELAVAVALLSAGAEAVSMPPRMLLPLMPRICASPILV
jgi:hypothetical protein